MKKKIFLIFCMFFICCLCWPNNNTYAAWGGIVQTKEERIEATKKAREVDLPALRSRAQFLKKKIEELSSKGEKKIKLGDTLIEGVRQVLVQMNDIEKSTGLPCKIQKDDYEPSMHPAPKFVKLEISQVVLKLEEAIAIIDSIIGPEQKATQTQN